MSMPDPTHPSRPGHVVQVALRYADHGWPVIPLHTPSDVGCSCAHPLDCGSPGKHPRTRHGLSEATTDHGRVRDWWTRWPTANVGVATGPESGLLVLDIDLPSGPASLDRLVAEFGDLPTTCEQRTGSGGRQLLFKHPAITIGNRAGVVPGVDVRGDGGYIVVPPSRHATGNSYLWTSNSPLAPPPAWLVALLTRDRTASAAVSPLAPLTLPEPAEHLANYGAAALRQELTDLSNAVEGSRNDSLNRAAFKLGQLVGAGALDGDEVRDQLERTGEALGLGAHEVRRTVTSGLTAGIAQPRSVEKSEASRLAEVRTHGAPVRQLVRRR